MKNIYPNKTSVVNSNNRRETNSKTFLKKLKKKLGLKLSLEQI